MKDFIITDNTANNVINANGVIPIGSAVHGYGKGIRLNGNGITINECGYFHILSSVSIAITAAGNMTVQLYENGTPVVGALATATGAAGDVLNLTVSWITRKQCPCDSKNYTLVASAAGTMQNITTIVEKV